MSFRNPPLHLEPNWQNICAIIVTYHPDTGFADRLRTNIGLLNSIVIIDNGSLDTELAPIRELATELGFEIVNSCENIGVAAALNQGTQLARQKGYAWVLTLDQDTLAQPNLINILSAVYKTYPTPVSIGVIGSNYPPTFSSDSKVKLEPPSGKFQRVKTVITAGSLISVEAFERIGGFRDNLFVDGVDEDFCLRLRRSGYHVLRTNDYGITQPIGSQTCHRFLWRTVGVSNHSPLRHYYMTRNRFALIAEHFAFDPGWCFSQLRVQMKMGLFVIVFEERKLMKLRAMVLGLIHAMSGRLGKLKGVSWLQQETV